MSIANAFANASLRVICIYYKETLALKEIKSFLSNFESLLEDISNRKSYLALLLGDYNARNTPWWYHDTATTKETQFETITACYGLQQLINEPTIIRNNSSSCIELIFTNQSNFIVNSKIHPSLHGNC